MIILLPEIPSLRCIYPRREEAFRPDRLDRPEALRPWEEWLHYEGEALETLRVL